jgi:hypothetical protein
VCVLLFCPGLQESCCSKTAATTTTKKTKT